MRDENFHGFLNKLTLWWVGSLARKIYLMFNTKSKVLISK